MYVCMYDLVGCSTTELLETLWLIEGVRGKKPHVTFDLILCAVVTSKKKMSFEDEREDLLHVQ